MKKPIIAFDVDDVLADSIEAYRLQVNKRTGASLTPEHYRVPGPYWKYFEHVWEQNGIHDKVPKDELFGEMTKDQSHVLPSEGASDVLIKLAKHYDLVVVTARAPDWQDATYVWLKDTLPDVFKDVHFAGNKHDPTSKSKGEMCVEVGASYLIDDNPEHGLTALEHGVGAVLYGEFGWHVDVPDEMIRCKTWKEIEEYFDAQRSR